MLVVGLGGVAAIVASPKNGAKIQVSKDLRGRGRLKTHLLRNIFVNAAVFL
jgi:hypothetical protein